MPIRPVLRRLLRSLLQKAKANPKRDNKPVTVAVAVAVGVLPKGAITVNLAVDDAVEKSSGEAHG